MRTEHGTGVDSTRVELAAAHEATAKHNTPEPCHCVIETSTLKHVTFMFNEPCQGVQADTPCAAVYVGGYDDPEMG